MPNGLDSPHQYGILALQEVQVYVHNMPVGFQQANVQDIYSLLHDSGHSR
jgi:hypothetical protein